MWVDLFYGPQQQNKIKQRVMLNGMAYYANGKPKRTVGVWYEDLAQEWTKEMELNDN